MVDIRRRSYDRLVMRLTTCERCGKPFAKRGRADRCASCRQGAPDPHQDSEYRRNRAIVLAGNPMCHWCGKEHATTADHILPVIAGGTHALSNLVPACADCNRRRYTSPGPPKKKQPLRLS